MRRAAPIADGLSLLLAHAGAQHDEVADTLRELALQTIEVIVALREHEWRSPRVHRLEDVGADAMITSVVLDQFLIQGLELDTPVRGRAPDGAKGCRLHECEVFKRSGCRLHPGIHAVPDRPALHEDNRVVAILPGDGCGQPEHEPGPRLSCDLFEAVG